MEGFIISYADKLLKNEITNLNYFLFGKVLSKKDKKYYYTGLLDGTLYVKLGNGCYFIITTDNIIINELNTYNNIIVYIANIDISKTVLKTAKQLKQIKYKDVYVKNL